MLTADSGWNAEALQGVFLQGLSNKTKDELVARDDPTGLDPLVSLATRLDNWEHPREKQGHPHTVNH